MNPIPHAVSRRQALQASASAVAVISIAGCQQTSASSPPSTPSATSYASLAQSILSGVEAVAGEIETALGKEAAEGATIAKDVLGGLQSFEQALESSAPPAAAVISEAVDVVTTVKTLFAGNATIASIASTLLTGLRALTATSTQAQVAGAFSFFAELALDIAELAGPAMLASAHQSHLSMPAPAVAVTRAQILQLRASL